MKSFEYLMAVLFDIYDLKQDFRDQMRTLNSDTISLVLGARNLNSATLSVLVQVEGEEGYREWVFGTPRLGTPVGWIHKHETPLTDVQVAFLLGCPDAILIVHEGSTRTAIKKDGKATIPTPITYSDGVYYAG